MKKDIYVEVTDNNIRIKYSVVYNKDGDYFSAYMPGFDIYFSAPTEEEIAHRGGKMVKTFFDFWIENQGWKQMFLKLHKLGFRTKMHNLAMKNFLRNKPQKGKFNPSNIIDIPDFFANEDSSKTLNAKAEMAI